MRTLVGDLGTFGAFRHDQFRLLFTGLVAGNVGIWMQQFAIGWLMVQLAVADGRPELASLYLGLRSLSAAIPALALGLFAGVIADRVDRRSLLMAARIASGAVAVVLAVIVITDRATLPLVLVLAAASSAAFAFDPPGRQAVLPNVVPRRDLLSAMGLTRASMQLARTFGPLLAGLMIIPVGIGGVLLAKASLDGLSIPLLGRMRPQPVEATARQTGLLVSFREGLAYIGRDDVIRWCVALQILFAVFVNSVQELLPALAVEALGVGALELSWMVAALGIGALVGAFVVASSERIPRRGFVLLLTMGAAGAILALLGLQRELLGVVLLLVLLGVAQQVFMGIQSVVLQLATPDRLRGRVLAVQPVIFMGVGSLGVFALGAAGTFVGVANALVGAGVIVLAVSAIALARLTAVRELRNDHDHQDPGSSRAIAVGEAAE